MTFTAQSRCFLGNLIFTESRCFIHAKKTSLLNWASVKIAEFSLVWKYITPWVIRESEESRNIYTVRLLLSIKGLLSYLGRWALARWWSWSFWLPPAPLSGTPCQRRRAPAEPGKEWRWYCLQNLKCSSHFLRLHSVVSGGGWWKSLCDGSYSADGSLLAEWCLYVCPALSVSGTTYPWPLRPTAPPLVLTFLSWSNATPYLSSHIF